MRYTNTYEKISWMSRSGERLAIEGEGKVTCPHTREIYLIQNGQCQFLSANEA